MPEEIYSERVIPKGRVKSVAEEPLEKFRLDHKERMYRFWVLTAFGIAVIFLCIYIVTSGNPEVHDFKSGAWSILTALGGGVVVAMTGASVEGRRRGDP